MSKVNSDTTDSNLSLEKLSHIDIAALIIKGAEKNNGKEIDYFAKQDYEAILTTSMDSIGWSLVNKNSELAKLYLLRRYVNARIDKVKREAGN